MHHIQQIGIVCMALRIALQQWAVFRGRRHRPPFVYNSTPSQQGWRRKKAHRIKASTWQAEKISCNFR
uniref:Secreted protein n=1 Tax=Ascaris lumbricoides TaxID=6252 RepID=A0A0M3I6N0_ASCLU